MMARLARVLVLIGASVAASSCARTANGQVSREGAARVVAVEHVRREDLRRRLELAAEFRPYQEIALHAKIAGYLKAIHVDVGDSVKRGQLIAELEAPEMSQEVTQADAALRRARVDAERANAEVHRSEAQASLRHVSFERLSAVLKARANLVAQQDIDDASARVQDADAQLSEAKSAFAAAEEQVQIAAVSKERLETMRGYLLITAPFAGTITKRLADPGAMIQAGTASHVQAMPIVELSQIDHLRLVLPVPESVVPRIRTSAPVEVRVEALKRVFQGRIARFTGKLDAATRTMETEVDLPNSDGAIKAGMFGYATLTLEQRQDVLTIPVQALAARSLPIKVLVVSADKRLEERQLEVGLETPDRVEVRSGLREGDMVVVGARSNLRAGTMVEPRLAADGGGAGTR